MKTKYYITILLLSVSFLYLIGFKNKSKAYKIFTFYLLTYTVLDYVGNELYTWFKIYNHFFLNLVFLFQFGFLSLFYSYSFENKKWRNLVEVMLILVSSYLLIKYLIFPETFFIFHYHDIYLTVFPIIIYSVLYLYAEYEKPQELYYINIAILIYLIMSFFSYLSWPLQSITIEHTYMGEFCDFIGDLMVALSRCNIVAFSIILLYQLKKLKSN